MLWWWRAMLCSILVSISTRAGSWWLEASIPCEAPPHISHQEAPYEQVPHQGVPASSHIIQGGAGGRQGVGTCCGPHLGIVEVVYHEMRHRLRFGFQLLDLQVNGTHGRSHGWPGYRRVVRGQKAGQP